METGSRLSQASGAGARRSVPGFTPFRRIVREIDDSTAAEIALIENIQREDLNAIEEAEGYRQLIERHGHTQEGSQSSSTNRVATSLTC